MNSARSVLHLFRRHTTLSYTDDIMTEHNATCSRLFRCDQEGNSLGQTRLTMSEVQICGIPKLSIGEVASTP
jgi:hypothetical protein